MEFDVYRPGEETVNIYRYLHLEPFSSFDKIAEAYASGNVSDPKISEIYKDISNPQRKIKYDLWLIHFDDEFKLPPLDLLSPGKGRIEDKVIFL